MAQIDLLRRYLEAGIELGQTTRSRAEAIVKELVHAGEVQREQAQERIDELMEWRRRNTEAVVELIRKEISNQLSAMGLATKADLAALERRLKGPTQRAPKKAAKKAKKVAKAAKKARG
jgi:polyhydroxyalkanoate synthesis regulator phasin